MNNEIIQKGKLYIAINDFFLFTRNKNQVLVGTNIKINDLLLITKIHEKNEKLIKCFFLYREQVLFATYPKDLFLKNLKPIYEES